MRGLRGHCARKTFVYLYEKSMNWVFNSCSDWLFPGTHYKAKPGVFAAYLNTSSFSTVQKWEQRLEKPNGPASKLTEPGRYAQSGSARLKAVPEEILSDTFATSV